MSCLADYIGSTYQYSLHKLMVPRYQTTLLSFEKSTHRLGISSLFGTTTTGLHYFLFHGPSFSITFLRSEIMQVGSLLNNLLGILSIIAFWVVGGMGQVK